MSAAQRKLFEGAGGWSRSARREALDRAAQADAARDLDAGADRTEADAARAIADEWPIAQAAWLVARAARAWASHVTPQAPQLSVTSSGCSQPFFGLLVAVVEAALARASLLAGLRGLAGLIRSARRISRP